MPVDILTMVFSDFKSEKPLHFYRQSILKKGPFRAIRMATLEPASWWAHNDCNTLRIFNKKVPEDSFTMHHSDFRSVKPLRFYPKRALKEEPFRAVRMTVFEPSGCCAHNKCNTLQNFTTKVLTMLYDASFFIVSHIA